MCSGACALCLLERCASSGSVKKDEATSSLVDGEMVLALRKFAYHGARLCKQIITRSVHEMILGSLWKMSESSATGVELDAETFCDLSSIVSSAPRSVLEIISQSRITGPVLHLDWVRASTSLLLASLDTKDAQLAARLVRWVHLQQTLRPSLRGSFDASVAASLRLNFPNADTTSLFQALDELSSLQ